MDLLLELGVEDLPSDAVSLLPGQLSEQFSRWLERERISARKVTAYATVRRLVLSVKGLPVKQPDMETDVFGPPEVIAFNPDGQVSRQGLRYCRAQGISPGQLMVKQVGKKRVVGYRKRVKGRRTDILLSEQIPALLQELSFPLAMRWGAGDVTFVRPVRSLLCLLDQRLLPVTFAGVKSRRFLFGHPTLFPGRIGISSAQAYRRTLNRSKVILDPVRRERILSGRTRSILPGGASFSPVKLSAICRTLEYPAAFLSRVDLQTIPYPPEVAALVIEKLKCLPLYGKDGDLLSDFILVTEGQITPEIKEGFNRVLENRLADALFFWKEDIRLSAEERAAKLSEVIFQQGVGTLGDYTRALEGLVAYLGRTLALVQEEREALAGAARLAKIDITTSMVREFPETAGIVGASLLRREGYPPPVCQAVREHLLPGFPGDRFPESTAGRLLGLGDRIIHICGLFAAGIQPSGTADPYGLRRLAQAALESAWKAGIALSLKDLIGQGISAWGDLPPETGSRIQAFFTQRLDNILGGRGVRSDIIAAVLCGNDDRITSFPLRSAALAEFWEKPEGPGAVTTFTRVTNIVLQARNKGLDPAAFPFRKEFLEEAAEKRLCSVWKAKKGRIGEALDREHYREALRLFAQMQPAVNRFFDQVLVMAPREELRRNRLSLLGALDRQLGRIGDLTRIQTRMQ